MIRNIVATLALILTLISGTAFADVGRDITIQGVLVDATGTPIGDDEYELTVRFYNAAVGGSLMLNEVTSALQEYGVFTATVHVEYEEIFDYDLWVELAVEGEPPMSRTRLTPVPVAIRASTVDPSNAVISLNSQEGDVSIVGGSNVTVSTSPGTITISAEAGAGGDDDDWTINGDDLYHSGSGTVALGTTTPQALLPGFGTTFQINAYAMPNLCLDRTIGGFERWAIFNGDGALRIGRTNTANVLPTTGMEISDTRTDFLDENGETMISLQTNALEEDGGVVNVFGTSGTPQATASLDGQYGTGGGGALILRDGGGSTEVLITSNHSGTGVGRVTTPILEITGGSDLSEQFDIGNTSLLPEPGMVVSIDPHQPGQLTLSEGAYDRRVAGVISGAGGVNTGMLMGQSGSAADGEHPVALVGRVYVWADATDCPIEPGDLLTTSQRPGHAMKVTDHGRAAGAILGKAMTGLKEGQGLVLTLVSLQ